jgi:two-component system, chemotaxis family, chemotaxis protein CheY
LPNTVRLMVVDDSNLIRTRISNVVQGGGLGKIALVGLARNGVEALRIARDTRPDLVTMDLTMPEMDGVQCIREMLRMLPGTSILVVSALNDKSTAIAALRLGARGFVTKPFTDDALRLALRDVMEAPVP